MITIIIRKRSDYRRKLENEVNENKISIMLSQIQPHFLYNTLSVIKWLSKTDSEQAEKAIDDFSDYLRGNMDSLSSAKTIPFEQELNHTRCYLNLEKMRFGDRLNIIYNTRVTDFYIPPLSIQPLVENAVRYGVTKRDEGGTIIISTDRTEDSYIIAIADDGIGFDSTKPRTDERNHIGIDNVRSRVSSMCGGTLDVIGTPGVGVVSTITLPHSANEDKENA